MNTIVARLLACAITMSAAFSAVAAEETVTHYPADRIFDMTHIKLDLRVDLKAKHVDAVATLSMTPLTAASSVTLDAVDFDVQAVSGGPVGPAPRDLAYEYDDKHLTIYLDGPAPVGQRYEFRIKYAIDDPKSGLHFFAPSKDSPDAPYQVWSQGESIENRYWVPCFDNPNEMQTTEIIANVDAKYEVLSNGRLLDREMTSDGRSVFHWLQDQPHASYLMTLVVGDFEVKQEQWRGIPVMYYVPPDKADEVQPTFHNTTRMLDFFSDSLGVKFPWAKYAQVCCYTFGGGMENTSATTLGDRSLRDQRALADGDADSLISHEMAHQWFGDLVTCRDWAHLWLNEGFASYFEAMWDEHNNGEQAFADNMADKARNAMRGDKDLPIVDRHYPDPDAQFDSRAYPKGAWVLHMLRRRLGDDLFWKSLHEYLTEMRHQPVETVDLRRVVERVSGRSFGRFFHDWTERPGHPVVTMNYSWNEPDRVAEIDVEQTQDADAFAFPLVIELHLAGGEPPVLLRREMTNKHERFLIPMPSRPVRLAVDPHQEVLMDLTETKPRDLWISQLRDDPNPAARVAAARELAKDKSDETRTLFAKALGSDSYWGVRVELANQLAKLGGDAARDALLANLGYKDARVRKACVAGLAKFDDSEQLEAPIRKIIDEDTESYGVMAAAIDTLAKWKPDDLMDKIKPMLDRDSPNDRIRSAAIDAIGDAGDASSVDMLMGYAGEDGARSLRRAAVSALTKIINREEVPDEARHKVVDLIAGGLTDDSRWVRSGAARALGDLGEKAAEALPRLREAKEKEKNDRAKEAIASAIEKIGSATPGEGEGVGEGHEPGAVAHAGARGRGAGARDHGAGAHAGGAEAGAQGGGEASSAESDALAKLREENKALRERLDSLEATVNGLEALMRRMTSGSGNAAAANAAGSAGSSSTTPAAAPAGASAP